MACESTDELPHPRAIWHHNKSPNGLVRLNISKLDTAKITTVCKSNISVLIILHIWLILRLQLVLAGDP